MIFQVESMDYQAWIRTGLTISVSVLSIIVTLMLAQKRWEKALDTKLESYGLDLQEVKSVLSGYHGVGGLTKNFEKLESTLDELAKQETDWRHAFRNDMNARFQTFETQLTLMDRHYTDSNNLVREMLTKIDPRQNRRTNKDD